MFSAFTNSFKIPELRQRIFFTLGLIFVARVGANLPLPGLNPEPLQAYFADLSSVGGGLVGMYNMFTGGALLKGAVFALGIMPYISASIILQLMGAVIPTLARLQQEGDVGRQKIAQYTRYLTIIICIIQGGMLSYAIAGNPENIFQGYSAAKYGSIVLISPVYFALTSIVIMTAGVMLLMWIGEQITQRGIGNGVSIIITIGILEGLPAAISLIYKLLTQGESVDSTAMGIPQLVGMSIMLVLVIAAIVSVTQATRKIPVQYAKRVVGRKVFGGQSSFLPLKINYAGVMPVIFASAIIMFPQMIMTSLGGAAKLDFLTNAAYMLTPGHWLWYAMYGGLIFAFSYFWVSIMFKPIQIADDLKKNGGYIPGVRPGEPTSRFLDFTMTRLTFAGALFLTLIAVMPTLLSSSYNIPWSVSQFFGGTGTLIAVGVMLDTMRQLETFLLQRHYDGFLKKGRTRSSSSSRVRQLDTTELKSLGALWWPLGIIFFVGILAWLLRQPG